MKTRISAAISTIILLVVVVASVVASPIFPVHAAVSNVTRSSASNQAAALSFVPVCSPASKVGEMTCLSLISTTPVQPTFAKLAKLTASGSIVPLARATGSQAPYGPNALHNAYNLPTQAATPQTVAIISSGDDPNAETDMNTYRKMFGIAPCTTANGCFTKVNQTGGPTFPAPDAVGAEEASLDLDMVSAICQNCHILLVEANAAGPGALNPADLGAAENEAVALGANEISNSFGGIEGNGGQQFCSQFFNHPGVVITASSGDAGSPDVEIPADCPNVVSIGGTTLNPNGTETAWNTNANEGAGGGCSTLFTTPPWQAQAVMQGKVTTNCAMRAGADVSAVADPATGVLIIDTFQQQKPTHQVGGTSASSPIVAAIYALAGGAQNATTPSGAIIPWTQITKGANCLNTVGGTAYAFQTGLGTPNGTSCF